MAEEDRKRLNITKRANRGQVTKLFSRAKDIKESEDHDENAKTHLLLGIVESIQNKLTFISEVDNKLTNLINVENEGELESFLVESDDYLQRVTCDLRLLKFNATNHKSIQTHTTQPLNTQVQPQVDLADSVTENSQIQPHINLVDNHNVLNESHNDLNIGNVETQSTHTVLSIPKRNVHLPKLNLPQFDGDILNWSTFYDTFCAAIHNNESLDNVQKFQYLKSNLIGEAARVVSGLQLTNSNYVEAFAILKERFGQSY
jgi:hypothetical protein